MDTNPKSPIVQSEKKSEKYIRTFANDMDTFQRGGTPGLTPLKEKPHIPPKKVDENNNINLSDKEKEPKESLTTAVSNEIAELDVAPPPPPVEAPEERLVSEKPKPVFIPEPEPDEPTIPVVEEKPIPLQTYADDFRERLKATEASTMTILAAQQDAPRPVPLPEEEKGNKYTLLIVVTSFFLVFAGSIGVYLAYQHYKIITAPVIIAPSVSAPLVVDSSEKISGQGSVLLQSIKQSVATPLPPNTIRLLSLDTASTTSVFAELLTSSSVPNILLRNIHSAGSIAGVVNTGNEQSPFFILSVSAYDVTFSGMLRWETTMQSDLGELFPLSTTQTIATSSLKIATTTHDGLKEGFRDEVVSNHDVRIYRDAQGKSILVYGYWNQTLLVIARDPAAFALILGRLATAHS